MTNRLLNAVVHTMVSCHPKPSIVTDLNNSAHTPNLLIPLSNFEGSHLFVEDDEGKCMLDTNGPRGFVYPVTLPFLRFDTRRRHLGLP